MGKKEKDIIKPLSSYEEDCIWMSYRYCIGRHTIAAHCHANEIAMNTYDRLTDNLMQFMSEDINKEIYDKLNWSGILHIENVYNVPKHKLCPLNILYNIYEKENIDSLDKMKTIKTIEVIYDKLSDSFNHTIYYYPNNESNKLFSFMDIYDLEIWQQLADLFNKQNYKKCKILNDKNIEEIITYYETWTHCTIQPYQFKFILNKIPVNKQLYPMIYLDENKIIQDNI